MWADKGGTPHASGFSPDPEPGPGLVREQLTRILASPLFKNSKHYPALLRYVVERTLEGQSAHLKERALGIEVFGRDPAYDTNLDPVVRTSASEVRKRLAQYYQQPGHEQEIRIELPSGCYVPVFRFSAPGRAAFEQPVAGAPAIPGEAIHAPGSASPTNRKGRYAGLAVLGLAVVAMLAGGLHVQGSRSALERFWKPVWTAADPVLLCVGSVDRATPLPHPAVAGPETVQDALRSDTMPYSDAITMARLAGVLREGGKRFDVRRAAALTLADLRRGPDVFIGAFNNAWTLRLNAKLRFIFEVDPVTHRYQIRDRQNPSKVEWENDNAMAYSNFSRDYAVVSRLVDPRTDQITVVVAGIGKDGTLAAGEFVTVPRYLEALARRAPPNWEQKNLQVVLGTEVINGNTGPPRILAMHCW